MKDRKKEEVKNVSPVDSRKAVIRHLLAIAEHTLKRSDNIEEQAEALECKRLLEARLDKLDEQMSVAA